MSMSALGRESACRAEIRNVCPYRKRGTRRSRTETWLLGPMSRTQRRHLARVSGDPTFERFRRRNVGRARARVGMRVKLRRSFRNDFNVGRARVGRSGEANNFQTSGSTSPTHPDAPPKTTWRARTPCKAVLIGGGYFWPRLPGRWGQQWQAVNLNLRSGRSGDWHPGQRN